MANGDVVLDEVDKSIIRELQTDGRMAYSNLAPLVGLSQAAARQRVNRLIENGAIQVVAVTDPIALGFGFQAMLTIDVDGDVTAVAAALGELEEVDYVVVVAGRHDIIAEVVCTDGDHLLDLVNDTIRPIDGVARVEVLTYLRLVKQSYNWGTR